MTDAHFEQFGHHGTLLKLIFTFLGENPQLETKNSQGACFGFSLTHQQAVLAGKEQEFYDRLTFLLTYISKKENSFIKLKEEIEAIYDTQKIALNTAPHQNSQKELATLRAARPALTDEQRKLLDIHAFVETTFLLQSFNKSGISVTPVTQENLEAVLSITAPSAFDRSKDYLHSTILGIIALDKKNLAAYFKKIEEIIVKNQKTSSPKKISFLLGSSNHAVSVYFDCNLKKWHFVDVNNFQPNIFNKKYYSEVDSKGLADRLFLAYKSNKKTNNSVFSLARLSTQGYDLALMTDFEHHSQQPLLPIYGKLYLSKEGRYLFLDKKNKTHSGTLSQKIDTGQLKDRLSDFDFKQKVIDDITLNSPYSSITPIDETDREIFMESNRVLVELGYDKKDKNNYNALMLATLEKQVYMVKKIIGVIKKKENYQTVLNLKNNKNISAFDIAAYAGNGAIVIDLIKEGIEKEGKKGMKAFSSLRSDLFDDETLCQLITLMRRIKSINVKTHILGHIKGEDVTILKLASRVGHLEALKALMLAPLSGAEKLAALKIAAKNGRLNIVQYLINENEEKIDAINSAFLQAAEAGQTAMLTFFLKTYQNSTPDKNTSLEIDKALFKAAEHGHEKSVTLLLEAKANPDTIEEPVLKNTPLILAARNGHLNVVQVLLKYGANLSHQNYKEETALQNAIEYRRLPIIEALINDININHPDKEGNTPLLLAVEAGNEALILMLLKNPALQIHCKNNKGETALTKAIDQNFLNIVTDIIMYSIDNTGIKNTETKNTDKKILENGLKDSIKKGHSYIIKLFSALLQKTESVDNKKLLLAPSQPLFFKFFCKNSPGKKDQGKTKTFISVP